MQKQTTTESGASIKNQGCHHPWNLRQQRFFWLLTNKLSLFAAPVQAGGDEKAATSTYLNGVWRMVLFTAHATCGPFDSKVDKLEVPLSSVCVVKETIWAVMRTCLYLSMFPSFRILLIVHTVLCVQPFISRFVPALCQASDKESDASFYTDFESISSCSEVQRSCRPVSLKDLFGTCKTRSFAKAFQDLVVRF
jgi:hypothetical protein